YLHDELISKSTHDLLVEGSFKAMNEKKLASYETTQKAIEGMLDKELGKAQSIREKLSQIYQEGEDNAKKAREGMLGLLAPAAGEKSKNPIGDYVEAYNKARKSGTTEDLEKYKAAFKGLSP